MNMPAIGRFVGLLFLLVSCWSVHTSAIELDHSEVLNSVHRHGHETSRDADLSATAELNSSAELKSPHIQWGTNETHIELQLIYPTTGWIALGLTPNGGMDQSDVLFGYWDDARGKIVVQDRFNNAKPDTPVDLQLDEEQDWTPISGSQNSSHTILRAVRSLRTCDFLDRPFENGFMKVIFSYYSHDPASENGPIPKHTHRGSALINFLDSTASLIPTEPIVAHINFTMENFLVPGERTNEFYCRLIKMPKVTKKMHTVMQTPVIDPRGIQVLHHILIFGCTSDLKPTDEMANAAPFACGPEHNTYIMDSCFEVAASWAVGGKGSTYPANAGFPITPELEGRYYLLEMHYHNPDRIRTLDSSGISFGLTDQLRQQDVGMLMMGIYNFDEVISIPPGVDQFTIRAHCSDLCTNTLPEGGIYIFSGMPHMHNRGRILRARHFRGKKELPPLLNNRNFEFNYQTFTDISPPRQILPGDRIVVECTYSTKDDNETITGGEGTFNEMCLGYFDYYPRINMANCVAIYQWSGLISAIRYPPSKLIEGGVVSQPGETLLEAVDNRGLTEEIQGDVLAHLKDISWTSSAVRRMEDFYSSNRYKACCDMSEGPGLYTLHDNPPFLEPFQDDGAYECKNVPKEAQTTVGTPTGSTSANTNSAILIHMLIVTLAFYLGQELL
ncbi:DBH-like monooxygenase protein 1 [Hypsibius exemplaris]|uniref:DBH-like monooxygenase protein 1 n=1 Tax=Hypsibius exemplaris TaxID=2072580 RepID=A0A1W0WQA0_HYPEX|nr:DBH-like monooxygenase protein 1 [Hypsibius exemplaris]